KALVDEGLDVYAIDASPTLVVAFRTNHPRIPVAGEAGEDTDLFGRTFDGVGAWGLIFLLSAEEQRRLIHRVAAVLRSKGRFLFTACGVAEPVVWNDAMTGLESRSLGFEEYRRELSAAGLALVAEYDDEG